MDPEAGLTWGHGESWERLAFRTWWSPHGSSSVSLRRLPQKQQQQRGVVAPHLQAHAAGSVGTTPAPAPWDTKTTKQPSSWMCAPHTLVEPFLQSSGGRPKSGPPRKGVRLGVGGLPLF